MEFYFFSTYLTVRVSFYVITVAFFQVLGQGPRLPLSWGSAISQLHHYLSLSNGRGKTTEGWHSQEFYGSVTSVYFPLVKTQSYGYIWLKGAWECSLAMCQKEESGFS